MIPSVAAIDSTQARICQAVCPPVLASAQTAPVVAIQENTRLSPMPISKIRISPSPIDFSSTRRNGGENIWVSALMAASNIGSSAQPGRGMSAQSMGQVHQFDGAATDMSSAGAVSSSASVWSGTAGIGSCVSGRWAQAMRR